MPSIWKLCCGWCNVEEEEDRQVLIEEPHPEPQQPTVPGGTVREYLNAIANGTATPPIDPQPKSRDQEEEDRLEQIFKKAERQIIDVSNYEFYSSEVDVAERSQKYQSMIAKHDEGRCDELPVSMLLENVGMDLPEVLQNSPLDDTDIDILRTWNKSCTAACKVGLQIEKRDDIVVFMEKEDGY